MGSIVFKTIAENIRSFFGREDELLADPHGAPEPASEVFERPHPKAEPSAPAPEKIIDKPLPESDVKLPFSPEDLRKALKDKQPKKEKKEEVIDISHEITEFESVLAGVEPQDAPAIRQETLQALEHGFFDEFSQFVLREDLDSKGALDGNILEKMKEFHRHHKASNEYLQYTTEVRTSIESKVTELKILENEWFHTQKQLEESQEGLIQLEEAIQNHSEDLKKLMSKAHGRKQLEKAAPKGKEFYLADGRLLSTLLDLKIALQTMPENVFRLHVGPGKHDFADWIGSALKDPEMANSIRNIKEKAQLQDFLSRLG